MRSIVDCQIGEKCIVRHVDKKYKYLLELGLTPDENIEILTKAPFNGPLSIRVRGTVFALRLKEAYAVKC